MRICAPGHGAAALRDGGALFLSVRRGWEAVCIERLDGRWVQSMAVGVGGALPLHVGAASRVLLAYEPRDLWEAYVARADLVSFTQRTPTTRAALFAALEATLATGCSVSDEDASRLKRIILEPKRERSERTIVEAAGQISRALGFSPGASARTVRGVA